MTARIVTQISYDAYCPDCGFADVDFDDEDDAGQSVEAHNQEKHK